MKGDIDDYIDIGGFCKKDYMKYNPFKKVYKINPTKKLPQKNHDDSIFDILIFIPPGKIHIYGCTPILEKKKRISVCKSRS
jgi:hypothetical protein